MGATCTYLVVTRDLLSCSCTHLSLSSSNARPSSAWAACRLHAHHSPAWNSTLHEVNSISVLWRLRKNCLVADVLERAGQISWKNTLKSKVSTTVTQHHNSLQTVTWMCSLRYTWMVSMAPDGDRLCEQNTLTRHIFSVFHNTLLLSSIDIGSSSRCCAHVIACVIYMVLSLS